MSSASARTVIDAWREGRLPASPLVVDAFDLTERPVSELASGDTFTATAANGVRVTMTVADHDGELVTETYPGVEVLGDGSVYVRGVEGCALFAPATIAVLS